MTLAHFRDILKIPYKDNEEVVPMKIFWKLMVVLGVVAAAGAAVLLWLRAKKNREEWEDDECCTWDDVCEECNGECDCDATEE